MSSSLARDAAAQDCDQARPSHPESPFNLGQSVTSRLSEAGHFRVWYVLDGEHAPPDASELVPAYVGETLAIAEQAYAHYNALGYAPVVSDQLAPCAAHDAAIDIYLMNFGGSADGTKVNEACGLPSAASCSGFLIVENDFAGYGYPDQTTALRTVVPHEYFHLIQARYDARIEPWFAEAGAQWATGDLYPDLADMERFFPVFFEQPQRSLDSASGGAAASYSYSTALFAVFLEEAYSASLMRESLERLEVQGPPSTAAIDAALRAGHESNLADAFELFAVWNAATGSRKSNTGYTNASSYPEVALTEVTSPSTITGTTISLSSHYFSVMLPRFLVSPHTNGARNRVWYLPFDDGTALALDAARELIAPTPLGPGVVIVVGVTTARSDAPFELTFSELEPETADAGGAGDASADAGALADGGDPTGTSMSDAGNLDIAPHPQTDASCGVHPHRTQACSWRLFAVLLGLFAWRKSRAGTPG